MIRTPRSALPAFRVTSGEVAYLLDGGEAAHRNLWTQTDGLPALGDGSVYRVQAASTQNGQISLGGDSDDAAVYHKSGESVGVTVTPSSQTTTVTNADGSTTTTKWQTKSLTVTFGNGDTLDLTGKTSFVMTENSADVSAVFEQISTTTPNPHDPTTPL